MQAADEFVTQARSTGRHWSRSLQHERSLRQQLQDNLETMAGQMLGLESKARGIYHPLGSSTSLENSAQGTSIPASHGTHVTDIQVSHDIPVVSVNERVSGESMQAAQEEKTGEKEVSLTEGIEEEAEEEDDEDKFFDAPEMLQEDLVKARREVYGIQPPSPSSSTEAQPIVASPEAMGLPPFDQKSSASVSCVH